jgi:hypothetical protein
LQTRESRDGYRWEESATIPVSPDKVSDMVSTTSPFLPQQAKTATESATDRIIYNLLIFT